MQTLAALPAAASHLSFNGGKASVSKANRNKPPYVKLIRMPLFSIKGVLNG